MGKSRVVKVSISRKSSELTLGIDRAGGVPGNVVLYGSLFEAGTINLIRNATVDLWVTGMKKATTTTGIDGRYQFNYTVGAASYDFYTSFPGNTTYFPDDSPLVQGSYAKIGTDLTIDVNPTYGAPPLAVTILGRLSRTDSSLGLGGKTVELWRNDVKIKTTTTKTSQPLGIYQFSDTISADADLYVYFAGDSQFEGCEALADVGVSGELPPDDEPPIEPPVAGMGAGLLLLALLVMSQE